MKHYAKRKPWELDQAGGYYHRHVAAMTDECLHSKADIAAELGWRDMEIDRLEKALDKATNEAESMVGEALLAENRWRQLVELQSQALKAMTKSPWRSLWADSPTLGALVVLRCKVDDEAWSRMKRGNPDLYRRGDFAFDIDRWERLAPDYAGRMGFTEYMELPW